jgi:hypothetical protein
MLQAPRNSHVQPLHVWEHVQKLTLCRQLLQQCCDEYGARHGIRIEIDSRHFTRAFFVWLDAISHNDDYRRRNPRDFYQFACGALLRELLHEKAVHSATHAPLQAQTPVDVASWWPAGYMLTYFCIGLLKRTLREECGLDVEPADALSQPEVWQSFRENLVEEPSLAIAYFDKFMGLEPNWREPGFVANRPACARVTRIMRPV